MTGCINFQLYSWNKILHLHFAICHTRGPRHREKNQLSFWTWKTRGVDALGMQTEANREKYVPEVHGKMTNHWLTYTSICLDYLHWFSLSWCCSRTFVILGVPGFIRLLMLRWLVAESMGTSVLSEMMLSCCRAPADEGPCSGYICVPRHGISSRVAWQFCWHPHFAAETQKKYNYNQNYWHTQCGCWALYMSHPQITWYDSRLRFVFLTAFCTGWTSEKWWNRKVDHKNQNYLMDVINYARC